MKVGIDFGSTYSSVSTYSPKEGVRALSLVEGESASIPSVVSVKKGKITCGKAAKDLVGKKTVRIFEAFKMLLNESDQDLIHSRGYDDYDDAGSPYTPREVTRLFLDSILKGIQNRYNDQQFEEIVICVPEIWNSKVFTLDGRNILLDVLQKRMSVEVGHVRAVTEPEAASAYFAYHYEKETGKPFNGHLLLIDYGGGTLDITLTEVCSDGEGRMEISYQEGGGAGENHLDPECSTIGSAGIAYMQRVVALSMLEAGLISSLKEVDYKSNDFLGAVRDLESQLKSADRMKEIEDEFGSYGSGYRDLRDILDEDPTEFISLDYQGDDLSVSYQTLFRAYREIIEPVFQEELDDINRRVRRRIGADPCEPAAGMRDDFKIALVGGFGSFYLVKKQLAEIYKFDANEKIDLRTKNIHADKRELAISLGAALLAADKVRLKKTAHYSIGLYSASTDQVYHANFAIRHHQNVEPGQPYYILYDTGAPDTPANRKVFSALKGNIKDFVIGYENSKSGGRMVLKQSMLERLDQLPAGGFWNCGFSLDESDVVSFHVSPSNIYQPDGLSDTVIPLDNFTRMFEMSEVEVVNEE